jgi:hypothetical protein
MTDDDSRPGFARFNANDSKRDIERKTKEAFKPAKRATEGYRRALDPTHQWRDTDTGKFAPKKPTK